MVAIHRRASGLSRIEGWTISLAVLAAARFTGLLAVDKGLKGEAVLPGGKATRSITLTDRLGSAMRIGDPEAEDRQLWQGMRGQAVMPMSETVFLGLISTASGLFGVVVGAALPLLREAWNNKRQARYLAIRVVCLLDEFVDECTNVVGDDGLCSGQRSADGRLEAQVSQPKGLPLPDDVDWRKHRSRADVQYPCSSKPYRA